MMKLLENVGGADLHHLMELAAGIRDQRTASNCVTFSPKVFIPLTRVCRDTCGYCTFAKGPKPGTSIYMSIDEVLDIAKAGAQFGCTEALFTLGDKPELKYPQARDELSKLGHPTTISYVGEAAGLVLAETGLLPHINAGVMSKNELQSLRKVSVSQGLMLESTSESLLQYGSAHFQCPDKVPSVRLSTIESAGELKIPFTSGLLIGIGESRSDRLESLLALHDLHQRYGHIQELIIQNFRAKKGTRMQNAAEPSLEELLWTIAMARIIFGPYMNIQAPPNLTPSKSSECDSEWELLIKAGINDWGGVSPVTKDFVNPEAPWPQLKDLALATAQAGKQLVPRLPVYPSYVSDSSTWLDEGVMRWVRSSSNSLGYSRGETWSPGSTAPFNCDASSIVGFHGSVPVDRASAKPKNGFLEEILAKASSGEDVSKDDVSALLRCIGPDFEKVCQAADKLRKSVNGDKVTYVINRNINYTNVCSYKCQFCAFSKGKNAENLRGKPYLLSLNEITTRTTEACQRGATEICMQGGIHPGFTGETYLEILSAVKAVAPHIHVHAFSPLEVHHGAASTGMSIEDYLSTLKAAGLGSLPGTAAEILDDNVRKDLCANKITTQQWLEVMEIAHSLGIRTTATIMFGHMDTPSHWATHLLLIRDLQKKTGGFTEFVPLPFVHMQAPIFIKGMSRRGPTRRECIIMHAVARLVLHPYIRNIQASWVKMGPAGAQFLLNAGCNDMGGVLMNESISRAAGASHGQELKVEEICQIITAVGRQPQQRTTLYKELVPNVLV